MTPVWAWAIVGPLFLVGFTAFFSCLVPRREHEEEAPPAEHHNWHVVEPAPFDWGADDDLGARHN